VTIREATEADFPTVHEFVEAYQEEYWARPYPPPQLPDEWLRDGRILLVERDGRVDGMAKGELRHGVGHVTLVYLRPEARRQGLGKALLRELNGYFREAGVEHVTLGVDLSNEEGLAVWRRLGFVEYQRELVTGLDRLDARLAEERQATSIGSVHVQTDDQGAIERAIARFVPRLFVSTGTVVGAPRNGWVGVYDAAGARQPELLRSLASELSNITGGVVISLSAEDSAVVRVIAFERGRLMDEYMSVPDHYGPVPPGDAVALRANPTVLGRLTGGDPSAIRAVARQGSSAAELPPAPELLGRLAAALGIEDAGLDFDEAAGRPNAVTVEHG
jgi:ribosomal protein S18 acetylase RimI-like enzyme